MKLRSLWQAIVSGFAAGLLISLGGCVFLASGDRYVGALLFSLALLCICYKKYFLYTGRVGDLLHHHTRAALATLLFCLIGNTAGTFACGFLMRAALPTVKSAAEALCAAKLEQSPFSTVVRAFFCGILVYLSVSLFREKKGPLPLMLGIPAFILGGFEHSIADLFYFAAAGALAPRALLFLLLVLLGNSLGGLFLPMLSRLGSLDADQKPMDSANPPADKGVSADKGLSADGVSPADAGPRMISGR